MESYKEIISNILEHGYKKQPTRNITVNGEVVGTENVGNATLMLPNVFWSHDMEDGFPLLTLRKMHMKSIMVELEGFIKGITDKSWYKDRGCNIWNEWCNPTKTKDKELQKHENDLGPIYGSQGRNFNGDECDQLRCLVETLHKSPNDRRMVVSYWNPLKLHMMALPPCHYAWNVTVSGKKLNLFWVQRSADLMLGVPFDIAHYAMLLILLCKESGLYPGNLSACFVDCHIYENHIEQAKEIVSRKSLKLPTVDITNFTSIFNWEYSDYTLNKYECHPPVKMEVTV